MRVARVRSTRVVLALGAAVALTTLTGGAAAAAKPAAPAANAPALQQAPPVKRAFKVTISPAYTTAGLQTTFQVTVANMSSKGTTLRSVQVVPPTGFTLARPAPTSPLKRKILVQKRTFSLRSILLKPGQKKQFSVIATAPTKCGTKTLERWTSHAFEGSTPSGVQLALQNATSTVGVTVICPQLAPCGDGGPACSTTETTNVSSYTAVSDAGSGTLVGGLDVGKRLVCGGYKAQDPNWYDSVLNNGPTSVNYQIQYTLKDTDPSRLRVCFGLPYEFIAASGNNAHSAQLPNGKPGFVGLLPACPVGTVAPAPAPTGPCVSSITPVQDPNAKTGYDANVVAQVPAQSPNGAPATDPWFGG
jgi:hypothetical protein